MGNLCDACNEGIPPDTTPKPGTTSHTTNNGVPLDTFSKKLEESEIVGSSRSGKSLGIFLILLIVLGSIILIVYFLSPIYDISKLYQNPSKNFILTTEIEWP